MTKAEYKFKISQIIYSAIHLTDEEWWKEHGRLQYSDLIISLLPEFVRSFIGEDEPYVPFETDLEIYERNQLRQEIRDRLKTWESEGK